MISTKSARVKLRETIPPAGGTGGGGDNLRSRGGTAGIPCAGGIGAGAGSPVTGGGGTSGFCTWAWATSTCKSDFLATVGTSEDGAHALSSKRVARTVARTDAECAAGAAKIPSVKYITNSSVKNVTRIIPSQR